MCGGGGIASLIPLALSAAAVATGNPELIPVAQGVGTTASGLAQGQSLGKALGQGALQGGLAFGGQELAGALANSFPQTAASIGLTDTGGNSLTDLLGTTSGAGSFSGPGTIGGDINSLFSPGTGLSQLFGGTPEPSSTFTDAFNNINNAAPNLEATAGATSPVNFAPGGASASYTPAGSTGASALAGGASGGGFDVLNAGEDLALPSSSGAGPILNNPFAGSSFTPSGNDVNSLFNTAFANPANAAPAANTGFTIPGLSPVSTLSGATTMTPSLGSNNSMMNGLLRSGLGALFSNNNNKGFDAQINAGQQIANQYQPFATSGTSANNTLAALLGLNGTSQADQAAAQANWQNTPGYQFALQQGINAVNADAAAKGQLVSGNNQRAIQDYGTGLANQTYNNYLANLQNQVGTGLNAAGGVATGLAGTANAQAGKGGAAANTQNTALGGVLNSLFPSNNPLLSLLSGNTGNTNSGLLNALFG